MDTSRKQNGEGINLTKEQMEELEARFLRLVSSEIEKDVSNWEDFYKVLHEACQSESNGTNLKHYSPTKTDKLSQATLSNDTTASKGKNKHSKEANNIVSKPSQEASTKPSNFPQWASKATQHTTKKTSSGGVHVNTERTKQQYRSNEHLKSNFSRTQEADARNNAKFNTGTVHSKQKANQKTPTKTENIKKGNTQNGTSSENKTSKESLFSMNEEMKQNNLRKTKENKRKIVKRLETNRHTNVKHSNVLNNKNLTAFKKKFVYFLKTADPYLRSCLEVVKNVFVYLICLLVMVLIITFKFLINVLWFIVKLILLLLLCIAGFGLKLFYKLKERSDFVGKFRHYFLSAIELIHLFTGINLKYFSKSKRKNEFKDFDTTPIELPTTSDQAVEYLINQKENKPYRTLCVNRTSTDEEIKSNYRKLARLVHPDKCEHENADEAFKMLDGAFKKISDPQKRIEAAEEAELERQREEFNKNYAQYSDDFKKMFEELLNTIPCTSCNKKHKRTLIKERNFLEARYCGNCNKRHMANNGDIWAENNFFGIGWTCYACFDGEVYELTEWAKCQNLRNVLVANSHRIQCRLGSNKKQNRRQAKEAEHTDPRKKKGKKERKKQRR